MELPNLSAMGRDELIAYIAKMQQGGPRLVLKISDKTGALMVQGLGQYPLTLYVSQWDRLIAFMPQIVEFIKLNRGKLATKPAKPNGKA